LPQLGVVLPADNAPFLLHVAKERQSTCVAVCRDPAADWLVVCARDAFAVTADELLSIAAEATDSSAIVSFHVSSTVTEIPSPLLHLRVRR